jgi:lipoprotein-releasing system permease protein
LYEAILGWRYLYRGKRSRPVFFGLVVSALVTLLGAAMFLGPDKPSPTGVAVLTFGALAFIAFGLLRLFSVFTTVSVAGVVLGVAALTVVLSVTSGFQQSFRDKVLGVNAHVLVMKNTQDFSNYRDVEEMAAKIKYVTAVQPFQFNEMQVTRGLGVVATGAVKGVDPARISKVLDLPQHMVEGTVDSLAAKRVEGQPPPLILGRELAKKLKAKLGDTVTLVSPLQGIDTKTWLHTGKPPKTAKFKITGIFYSGFDEYDRRLMYVDIKEIQDFLEQGDVVMGVEMRLSDVEKASWVASQLEKKLGGDPWSVMDWQELNKNLFTALKLQKIALTVFLTLIIIVAAFNMVAALTMMVFDKTKEIAILKSMGGTAGGSARVFQVVGLTIGGVGTVVGLALGLLLCSVVSRYGYPLDPKVYLIDQLPIRVNPAEVVMIGIITMVISAAATLYPAFKASSLPPVEGLRYE